ncbi:MAG: hypothetical protein Q8O71_03255 [bacterium]|nr:hypothetical protein [bacterium]
MKDNNIILYVLGLVIVASIAFGVWVNSKPKPAVVEDTNSPVSSNSSTPSSSSAASQTGGAVIKETPVTQTQTNPNVKTVLYRGTLFEPAIIEINHGQEILFINKSSSAMRLVFSVPGTTAQSYTSFDQVKTVGKDGTYQLIFNQPGIWNFYNLNGNKAVIGTVNVK